MKPLDKAIEVAQGVSKLADQIGVRQSVVSNWRARGTLIEPLMCVRIERATNGEVTRRQLRPVDWQEIWPELACDVPAPTASEPMHRALDA